MNNKKLILLAILLTFWLTVAACTRERRINREDLSPTQTQVEAAPTATTLPVQSSMTTENNPLPATMVAPVIPSSLPSIESPAPAQSPEISGELAEIDSLLRDLDQILGGTDTNVNIP